MFNFLKTIYDVVKPLADRFNAKPVYTADAGVSTNAETEEKVERWQWPVKNVVVTSPYGKRKFNGSEQWHTGVDYTSKGNQFCIAPTDLKIVEVVKPDYDYPCRFKWNNDTQQWLLDETIPKGRAWTPSLRGVSLWDETITFIFRHIDTIYKVGDTLYVGECVGELGNFGFSAGCHLHFEMYINGKVVDPSIELKKRIGV